MPEKTQRTKDSAYAERLQKALDLSGGKRKDLAAALGITTQSLGQVLLKKTRAFTAENNARAAKYLKVDSYWLATGEGEPEIVAGVYSPRSLALAHAFDQIPGEKERDVIWATTLFFASGQTIPPPSPDTPAGAPGPHGPLPRPTPGRDR